MQTSNATLGSAAARQVHASLSLTLQLIAAGSASSRAELARATGLASSTVAQRVDLLLGRELLIETGAGPSSGGRPPRVLRLNPHAGLVLGADIGATHARLAIADLSGAVLAETAMDVAINDGPLPVLMAVEAGFSRLLDEAGRSRDTVRAIGIGLPGPVDFSTGTVVRPPIMHGWDGYRVPDFFRSLYDAAVVVDNDVNVMALGEQRSRLGQDDYMLFLKVGTGIGCGIITHGQLHRGADGAAGDVGHIQLPDHDETVCRCGNTGCVEAVASGASLVRDLQNQGIEDVTTSRDVIRLAKAGEPTARRAVRLASEHIGEVLAGLVNFYNPRLIVVGGALAQLEDEFLSGIRSVIYRRALPLATRAVRIETSVLGERVGITGAVGLAAEHLLSPVGVGRLLNAEAGERTA